MSEAVEFAGSPKALHESKARKHGHCRGRTSSIGADRGEDGIWIYGLAGSFITFNSGQIASGNQISNSRISNFILVQFLSASHGKNATVSVRESVLR
jgi:hypothetical protein